MPAGPNQVLMTGSACHKILLIYRVVCLWEEEKVERQRQDRDKESYRQRRQHSWASSPLGNFRLPCSQPSPSLNLAYLANLPRLVLTAPCPGLVSVSRVTVSFSPIVFTESSVQCGTRFRTWGRVAFVIHFPYSLMRIMAFVPLHCSSKAWYSSRHSGRMVGRAVGWGL